MGCGLSRPSTLENTQRDRAPDRRLSEYGVSREAAYRREGGLVLGESNGSAKTFLIDKKPSGSNGFRDDHSQKSMVKLEDVYSNSMPTISMPTISAVPRSREGEQVAAGWPSWLASAAGEALRGWIPRKADSFEKLDKIGQGTYSSVYKAQDLIHSKLVALKRVRFDNLDPESVNFMAREILILRQLDHPNIIKLEGLIASPASSSLYLIFEYMEHDLTGLSSIPGVKFTEPQIKCYMKQLLSGLEHCHSRGVLHRDIKGSNLLIDNSGILKIADFGLASFYFPRENIPMTSRVVTLWYRPPELLLGAIQYTEAVDMWSTGCILGELYYGKPLMPGRTEVEQLHKVFKLCGSPPEEFWSKSKLRHAALFKPHQPYRRRIAERFMDVPPSALQLIETLLSFDPAFRGTATSALKSEFFTTEPLACAPSSLPKYPPSKEIDVKLRDEENKRRAAVEGKVTGADPSRKGPEQNEAALADKANANLVASVEMQARKRQSFLTNRNQTFNSYVQEPTARNPETTKQVGKEIFDQLQRRGLHYGPLTRGSNTEKRLHDPLIAPRELKPVTSSTSATTRPRLADYHRPGPSIYADPTRRAGRLPGLTNELDPSENDDRLYYSQRNIYSNQSENKAFVTRPTMNLNKDGYGGSDEQKIHYSGPLMLQQKNVDEMLRERDRRIQEAGRRARFEKPNQRRIAANLLAASRR